MEDKLEIGCDLTIWNAVKIEADPANDYPAVSVKAEVLEGRYVCKEITVRAHGESKITSEKLRDIAVGFYVQWAAEACNHEVDERLTELAADAMRSSSRITDDLLEVVAATYRWGYAVSGNPTAKIMEFFGIERPRAAKCVSHCRERGFLGATDVGRAGGVVSEIGAPLFRQDGKQLDS